MRTILATVGHHPECRYPWDDCACAVLWQARAIDMDPDGLACAYGRFYDPDWESDPHAVPESYGGWNRAYYPGVMPP
jgi:hypothetical protein